MFTANIYTLNQLTILKFNTNIQGSRVSTRTFSWCYLLAYAYNILVIHIGILSFTITKIMFMHFQVYSAINCFN